MPKVFHFRISVAFLLKGNYNLWGLVTLSSEKCVPQLGLMKSCSGKKKVHTEQPLGIPKVSFHQLAWWGPRGGGDVLPGTLAEPGHQQGN